MIQIEICDEPASVSIFAESKEAAQKARQVSCGLTLQEFHIFIQILEFCEDIYLVPRKMVGRLIGQKGKSIQVDIEIKLPKGFRLKLIYLYI